MGILEEILSELQSIKAALAGGASATKEEKKTTTTKKAEPKGPTLEEVQDKIRELVAANEDHKTKIKAAVTKLGGNRAGDFEGDAAKLGKLMAALEAMGGSSDDGDDDLL